MTDYRVRTRCQHQTENATQCRRRARHFRGRTVALCSQHAAFLVDHDITELEPRLMPMFRWSDDQMRQLPLSEERC